MAIEGINSISGLNQAQDRKVNNESREKQKTSEARPENTDKVDVASGDVAKFKTQLDSIPDVRSDKIEDLQEEIRNGTYKVPSEQLANIFLDELI